MIFSGIVDSLGCDYYRAHVKDEPNGNIFVELLAALMKECQSKGLPLSHHQATDDGWMLCPEDQTVGIEIRALTVDEAMIIQEAIAKIRTGKHKPNIRPPIEGRENSWE
jgi:hypothetical protein